MEQCHLVAKLKVDLYFIGVKCQIVITVNAWLFCEGYSNGRVQLVGGATSREGRVEIWYNSQWNTVCDDDWDISDANVVCQQLGFQEAVTAHQSAHHGRGTGQILLDDLQCTGREASLLECSHRGINIHDCGHSEDASVTCECRLCMDISPTIIIIILEYE